MIRMPNCVFMIEGDVDLQLAALHLTLCFGEHSNYNAPVRSLCGWRKTWLGTDDFMDDIRWKIQNGVLYNVYAPYLGKKAGRTHLQ